MTPGAKTDISGRNTAAQSARQSARSQRKQPSVIQKIIPLAVILGIVVAGFMLWRSTRHEGFGDGFSGGNGRLEGTEIDISTKLAGRIVEIRVDEGDYVKTGDVLAVMQLNVLEAQLAQAQAQAAKARADALSSRAQVAVKVADVNAALATVAQRESELEQTRRRLQRSEVLSQKGVITGQEYDDDETTEMAAKAAVETAKANVDVARAAVESAKADAIASEASVKAAEASVASIEADIKDSHLVAPRDGRVQYRIVQPGEVLAAGGKVLNFVDLHDVYMNFFLPAAEAGRVAIGGEARILLDAFPGRPFPATVTFVASTAQFTPKTVETESERQKLMFRVKAKVDRDFLDRNLAVVKTGLPGVAWVRLDPAMPWPPGLELEAGGEAAPQTGATPAKGATP